MAQIIAVANQKGGVAKTTCAINLGACMAAAGKRVLLVDLDPQGSMTLSLGIEPDTVDPTIYNVLTGEMPATRAIRTLDAGFDLLPANIDLAAAELELVNEIGRERVLKEQLAPLADRYDLIFIDTPPSLGLLTINALTAANHVVVPLQCQYLALRGVSLLLRTIQKVKAKLNPELSIAGIVGTMYDNRTLLSKEALEELRNTFRGQVRVFDSVIKTSVRLAEAPMSGQSILAYRKNSIAAMNYRELADELTEVLAAETTEKRVVTV